MKIKKIRYNRKKVFIFLFLFLFLLGIGIGFAYVNTSLEITGIAKVKDAKWGIQLNNYTLTDGSVTPNADPTITDTTISFAAKVNEPGEFYGFSIDVENNGTINAAIANFNVSPDFSTINYLDASFTYEDGTPVQNGDLLIAGTAKRIIVRLSYKDGIDESLYPTTDQSFNVVVSLNYEQYMGSVSWTLPQGKNANNLSLGDELCLDNQCFNFVRYDENGDAVLLSKYNLKVGDISIEDPEDEEDTIKVGEYTSSDIGYGLQSSEARGFTRSDPLYKGVLPFAEDAYWIPCSGGVCAIGDEYSENNTIYVDDYGVYRHISDDSETDITIFDPINYAGAPGTSNFSVAYYVEQYKAKLISNYHVSLKDVRLLTSSEVLDSSIGCEYDLTHHSCPTTGDAAFITNTTYWLGSSCGADYVYSISTPGIIVCSYPDYLIVDGVRPVVVVEKSKL